MTIRIRSHGNQLAPGLASQRRAILQFPSLVIKKENQSMDNITETFLQSAGSTSQANHHGVDRRCPDLERR